ncbi:MAG: ECF transporter S component [Streptococcaceae bacterium]|jgi:uncharacterized membrane protein|nr:ECF transporter S component [Streptococcaceae bacterium]
MRNEKTKKLAIIAMFVATIAVLAAFNQIFLAFWPFPIKPTILHVPVIIASIVLGPKLGAIIGTWWGFTSVFVATVTAGPTNFLFSPFQTVPGSESGDLRALLIAVVPRILVGVLPYFVYKAVEKSGLRNPLSLGIAGFLGSATNTIFVLGAIFLFFGKVLGWNLQILLTSIVATNSVAEAVLAAILVGLITPTLIKVYNK